MAAQQGGEGPGKGSASPEVQPLDGKAPPRRSTRSALKAASAEPPLEVGRRHVLAKRTGRQPTGRNRKRGACLELAGGCIAYCGHIPHLWLLPNFTIEEQEKF